MILVTGGTGLLGSHLLLELTNDFTSIKAIFRNEKKMENIRSVRNLNHSAGSVLFILPRKKG